MSSRSSSESEVDASSRQEHSEDIFLSYNIDWFFNYHYFTCMCVVHIETGYFYNLYMHEYMCWKNLLVLYWYGWPLRDRNTLMCDWRLESANSNTVNVVLVEIIRVFLLHFVVSEWCTTNCMYFIMTITRLESAEAFVCE